LSVSDAVAVAPDGPSVASLIQMAIQEVLSGQVGGGPNLLLGNVTVVVMDTYATITNAVDIVHGHSHVMLLLMPPWPCSLLNVMNDTYWQNNLDLVGSVQWNTPLGQCQVFNLPSPNFGVSASSINLGLTMSSTIQLELCWSFEMDIGYSNVTGMFLDVTDTNLITYVPLHKRNFPAAAYI
jgi:hypothetical protein